MTEWNILNSGCAPASVHMQRDAELLSHLSSNPNPCLHHYDWLGESLTYGYFSNPSELLKMEAVQRRGMNIARRPSGGGVLFHVTDLAFSVLIPAQHPCFSLNTLQNYALINQAILRACESFLGETQALSLTPESGCLSDHSDYCMAHASRYDLVRNGKKLGGAAQRRTRDGFLHQGSIYLIAPPQELLLDVLPNGMQVIEAMARTSQPLLGPQASLADLASARHTLRGLIGVVLKNVINEERLQMHEPRRAPGCLACSGTG